MKHLFISFLLISVFFIACKNDSQVDIVKPVHSATLQVTVLYTDTTGGGSVVKPLSGVTIYLYLSASDRANSQNVKYTKVVTDSGKATFTQLPDDYYYILASHPTRGSHESETATPNNSTSYEEIDY